MFFFSLYFVVYLNVVLAQEYTSMHENNELSEQTYGVSTVHHYSFRLFYSNRGSDSIPLL